MNMKNESFYRALWAVLFLINLGASIALNLLPLEATVSSIDLRSTAGWHTIVHNGKTYYYNEQVGLVEKDSGQAEKELDVNLIGGLPLWLLSQLFLGIFGLILVLIKRPQPLKCRHRLNIAFGFLIIAWLNLVNFAIGLQQEALNNVPVGYIRIALPPLRPSRELLGTEQMYLLTLGLGISIFLGYLWIRWDRASRPDEIFL